MNSEKLSRTTEKIIEYGVYIFIIAPYVSTSVKEVTLVVLLVAWLTRHIATRGALLGYLRHPISVLAVAFCIIVLISTFYSHDVLDNVRVYKNTLGSALLLILTIPDVFVDRKRISRLLNVVALTGLCITLFALSDYIGAYQKLGRGILSNPALFRDSSITLELYLPFTLAAMLTARSRINLAWSILLIVQSVLIVVTAARGVWVAVAVALSLWAILKFDKKIVLLCAISAGVIAGVLLIAFPTNIVTAKFREGFCRENIDYGCEQRIKVAWDPAYEMIAAKPLLGYGYGDYFGVLERNHAEHPHWVVYRPGPYGPHNNYLEIWFSAGILALVLMIFLYASLVDHLYRFVRSSSEPLVAYVGLAALTAFAGHYLIHGFIEDIRWRPLGILLGIAIVLCARVATAAAKGSQPGRRGEAKRVQTSFAEKRSDSVPPEREQRTTSSA